MAKTEKVRVAVEVHGLTETTRAFRKYGKEANKEIRAASKRAVETVTPTLIAAMTSDSAQSRLVAGTVRAVSDRVPALAAGGAKRVKNSTGASVPSGDVFFGAEFGGGGRPTTQQFRPHRGTEGYAFYPAFRKNFSRIIDAYYDGLDRLERSWNAGPQ